MPNILQRCIDFVAGIRDDFTQLRLSLKEHSEAIRENTKTVKEHYDSPPILRAELQIPESIKTHTEGNSTKHQGLKYFKVAMQVLTLLFVAAYTIITYCSFKQSQRQAEDQTRPWVGAGDGAVSDVESDGMLIRGFKVKLTNYGHSPALGLIHNPTFTFFESPTASVTYFEGICEQTDDNQISSHTWSQKWRGQVDVAFPGDAGISQDARIKWPAIFEPGGDHQKWAFLYGCISYSGSSDSIYHTKLIYKISFSNPTTSPQGIRKREIVSFDRIFSEPH